ncbi:MAG: hypothetical protein KBH93_08130 [Anaerolineae bacterium]|nr:hypothetical protein [Anaerolineae bacterium]
MSEETRLVLQALIGLMVAVIAAFLTNWLNRRFFREQLGEQRYVEVYLDKMLDLWGEVADIYKDTSGVFLVIDEQIRQEISQEKVEQIYREGMKPIVRKTISLGRYYSLLSQSTIDALRQLEGTLVNKSMNINDFDESLLTLGELSPLFNKVFEQVRNDLSNLVARETTVSKILASQIDITPLHISEILSKPRENPFGAEGKAGQHL